MSRIPPVLACALVLTCCLAAAPAAGQGLFGKNKVVYADRAWQVFEEGKVHLYFYEEEEDLARQTLAVAVEAYAEFAAYFRHEFTEPVPLILYGTHHDFKQTHVTPGFISEGTAGFTEFTKGRIAIRATGNYGELRHLIRHEMVHAFMLAKLAKVMGDRGIFDYIGPPLWFIEGLAENVAHSVPDTQGEMFVRDAVLHDQLVPIPELWRIEGTFLMYKLGESILGFLRVQFGDDIPVMLLEAWWRGRDFEEILRNELGLDSAQLSDRWSAYLKRRHFPEVMTRRSPVEEGDAVLKKPRIELAPTVLSADAQGNLVLTCLGARGGLLALYQVEVGPEQDDHVETLVESGRQARFETLPVFRSRVDAHRGEKLAFVAKNGGQDALYLYDLRRRRVEDSFLFVGLREISSPSFSPDGRRIVFSGLSVDGFSDLYLVDVPTRKLRRLTEDLYDDVHPDWHPVADRIVFASDRLSYLEGRHGLFSLDLSDANLKTLTLADHDDTEPRWSPDGSAILFVSDRAGTRNLHVLRDTQQAQLTNLTGGVYLPDWIADETGAALGVVASVFHKGTFHLYRFDLDDLPQRTPSLAVAEVHPPLDEAPPRVGHDAVARDYRVRLGLDFVQSVAVVDPDLPIASGASLGFTDLLGDHQVSMSITTSGEDFSLEDLTVLASYSNLARRWNRHVGVFRINTLQRLSAVINTRQERRTGAFVGLTYPFSVFDRVEFSLVGRYLERAESLQVPGEPGNSWLASAFASYVHDNTLWAWTGPMRGARYNVTVGETVDLLGRGFDRQTIQLDYRRYFELWRSTSVAIRWNQRHSFGNDSAVFYVGGPNDLRGYDWFEFFGDRVYLGGVELRFPLLERLSLRFPFARFDIPYIQGAVFSDAADIEGPVYDTGWIGSIGYGVYLTIFPPLVVRMDMVRTHDFDQLAPWDPRFSLAFLY